MAAAMLEAARSEWVNTRRRLSSFYYIQDKREQAALTARSRPRLDPADLQAILEEADDNEFRRYIRYIRWDVQRVEMDRIRAPTQWEPEE